MQFKLLSLFALTLAATTFAAPLSGVKSQNSHPGWVYNANAIANAKASKAASDALMASSGKAVVGELNPHRAHAKRVDLNNAIVWNPKITFPVPGWTFHSGEVTTITWDTSDIPPSKANEEGEIVIGRLEPNSENLEVETPLAQHVKLSDGKASVTIPDEFNGDNYIFVLFGDSGNKSPNFKITGHKGLLGLGLL